MKAWIARCGKYECEVMKGVFLDKEKANFWEKLNTTSDKMNTSGWLEEVEILDDTIKPTQLYIKYKVRYDGKALEIISSELTQTPEKNTCKLCNRSEYRALAGDYICDICFKYEERNEELIKDTAAKLIAQYKVLYRDESLNPVEIQLMKGMIGE